MIFFFLSFLTYKVSLPDDISDTIQRQRAPPPPGGGRVKIKVLPPRGSEHHPGSLPVAGYQYQSDMKLVSAGSQIMSGTEAPGEVPLFSLILLCLRRTSFCRAGFDKTSGTTHVLIRPRSASRAGCTVHKKKLPFS